MTSKIISTDGNVCRSIEINYRGGRGGSHSLPATPDDDLMAAERASIDAAIEEIRAAPGIFESLPLWVWYLPAASPLLGKIVDAAFADTAEQAVLKIIVGVAATVIAATFVTLVLGSWKLAKMLRTAAEQRGLFEGLKRPTSR